MSAQIITVSGDKRLQLSNSQILRRPVYLDDWTKIRIGLRLNFPAAGNVVGTPMIAIGMCSGTTNGIADATTTNFIGLKTDLSSWTLASNVLTLSSGMRVFKKVATTVTDHASQFNQGQSTFVSGLQSVTSCFIVQIEKGSPNYTIRLVAPNSSGAGGTHVTQAKHLDFMEMDAALTNPGSIQSSYLTFEGANKELAMDEVAGVLDTINIYWDKTAVPCEIAEIYHRKVA